MSKLNREKLYMMASAKAQLVAAAGLLREAAVNVGSSVPGTELHRLVMAALEASEEATEAMFKRMQGEVT